MTRPLTRPHGLPLVVPVALGVVRAEVVVRFGGSGILAIIACSYFEYVYCSAGDKLMHVNSVEGWGLVPMD